MSFYLRDAIKHWPPTPEIALLSGLRFASHEHLFAAFNDTCRSFAELRAVIEHA